MLIKLQDGTGLINFDKIEFILVKDKDVMVAVQGLSQLRTIGKYSSKEKALKVLDLISDFSYQFINSQNPKSNISTKTVFQMPQDNEVS